MYNQNSESAVISLDEKNDYFHTNRGLLPHPQEFECHYTAIVESEHNNSAPSNQFFEGYNFFSSSGIEACYDTLACCLTAYNEPLIEYQKSIGSLCACAEFFRTKGEDRVSREFLICIIIDGLEKVSSEFSIWAKNLGIYDPACINAHADFHMFESLISRRRLYSSCMQDESFGDFKINDSDPLQRIIVFIKKNNRGKLDSHQCFFDRVFSFYSAKYFVQIDVGTTPMDDALYKMWFELQTNPDVAATAARSLLPYPDNKFDLLQVWQYCDIAVERIVNWPSEIFLGSLSVLPGQLSLTRISSVIDHPTIDKGDNVLDRYYRGLKDLNPFESNMYLAEDRILGQEMVFRKHRKWELSYQTDAEATVDACQSWSELCRQRRRWICSSMACRIAMLTKLAIFFQNPSRTFYEKCHKLVATIYFTIYSLLEWFVPATHLTVQTTLICLSLSISHNPTLTFGIKLLGLITFLCVSIQSIIAFTGKLSPVNQKLVSYGLLVQSLNIAANLLLLFFSGLHSTFFVGFFVSIFLYIAISSHYQKVISKHLALTVVQYTFSRLPVKSFLMTYSIFHAHDTSWGTKGLNSSTQISGSLRTRQQYKVFRIVAISLFISTNISLFYYFYSLGSFQNAATLYAIIIILLGQLTIAVFSILSSKLKLKRKII